MTIKEAIQILELNAPISKATLKKAYRDALMVWHPDRFAGNTELKAKAEGRTYQINEAYAVIKDIPESCYPFRVAGSAPEPQKMPPPPATPPSAPANKASSSKQPPKPAESKSGVPRPHVTAKKTPSLLTIAALVVVAAGGWLLAALFNHVQSPITEASSQSLADIILNAEPPANWAPPSSYIPAPKMGTEELELRAREGDKNAQFLLGVAQFTGSSVEEDPIKASKWFHLAAEEGLVEAQTQLGFMYLTGIGVVQNTSETAKWFRRAADKGDVVAQTSLGLCYVDGTGVNKDDIEALKWYRMAAKNGYAPANYELGLFYLSGTVVPRDGLEAVRLFRLAAEKGNADAQNNLANAYDNGEGVPQDHAEAAKWYRKSADQGHILGQFNLGLMYHNGQGVAQDLKEAAKWYLKAADQGDAHAQTSLGLLLKQGEGVQKNENEAVKWFRFAAEQGLAMAQLELGQCLFNGQGVSKNTFEGVQWFQRAAEAGEAEAQSWLGTCYANGDGIRKDTILAHAWLSLASANGVVKATQNLAILEKEMTTQQIAEAARLKLKTTQQNAPKGNETAIPNLGNAKNLVQAVNPIAIPRVIPPVVKIDKPLYHLPTDDRLSSGSLLIDHLQTFGGKGKLTLVNGLSEDAFVKMINQEKLVAAFYVRGGDRFTFDHVPDGVYRLIYCTGFGWNAGRRDFSRGRHAVRYDEALDYATTRRTEGTTIITSTAVLTLTLHKVANGNTKTSDIPLEEFDRY